MPKVGVYYNLVESCHKHKKYRDVTNIKNSILTPSTQKVKKNDAKLGIATAGFPNLVFGYGPQSPCAFCNGPSSAEYQGELIVELFKHMRDNGLTRIEALPEAQEAWAKMIADFWNSSLFPKADSWYQGKNIPGKHVESLNFPMGLPTYVQKFKESVANGYEGFAMS